VTSIEASSSEVILQAQGIEKHYGGVIALRGVDLEIRQGEVLALIGDNGAGKSTLVKSLCGAVQPDAGEILLRGRPIAFTSPLAARLHGIETVYQDLALAPFLDVAANLFLGRELVRRFPIRRFGVLNRRAMAREAKDRLLDLEISVPAVSGIPTGRLSGGQRQAIAVARAAAWATEILFLDEPTAALGVKQSEAVLTIARRLAERGTGVVLITHTLPYVMEFADRVVVLRHGRKVADLPCRQATPEKLVSLIVGFNEEHQSRMGEGSHKSPESADEEAEEI
jgi:simple sugar transport system ATP-binding protein